MAPIMLVARPDRLVSSTPWSLTTIQAPSPFRRRYSQLNGSSSRMARESASMVESWSSWWIRSSQPSMLRGNPPGGRPSISSIWSVKAMAPVSMFQS